MKTLKIVQIIESVLIALALIAVLLLSSTKFGDFRPLASYLLLGTALFYFIYCPIYCFSKAQTLLRIIAGLFAGFSLTVNIMAILYNAAGWPGAAETAVAAIVTTLLFGGISLALLFFIIKKGPWQYILFRIGASLALLLLFHFEII